MTREWYIDTWHRYWRFAEEHDEAVLYHVDNHGCLEVVNQFEVHPIIVQRQP